MVPYATCFLIRIIQYPDAKVNGFPQKPCHNSCEKRHFSPCRQDFHSFFHTPPLWIGFETEKALEAPLYYISANAGLEGAVIINKVRESEVGTGYDALNDEYVNMIDAGILDPAKVTRSALQNATSVASTLLTTESVVADIKEDTPAMPAGAAGMGGMM